MLGFVPRCSATYGHSNLLRPTPAPLPSLHGLRVGPLHATDPKKSDFHGCHQRRRTGRTPATLSGRPTSRRPQVKWARTELLKRCSVGRGLSMDSSSPICHKRGCDLQRYPGPKRPPEPCAQVRILAGPDTWALPRGNARPGHSCPCRNAHGPHGRDDPIQQGFVM